MKKLLLGLVVAAALALSSSDASAQVFIGGGHVGHGGGWHGGGHVVQIGGGHLGHGGGWGGGGWGGGHWDYHDTTHVDWHPGGFQRHGNHLHYRQGHWDVHQTGHNDWHGGHH